MFIKLHLSDGTPDLINLNRVEHITQGLSGNTWIWLGENDYNRIAVRESLEEVEALLPNVISAETEKMKRMMMGVR
jgi:hypothetical protein